MLVGITPLGSYLSCSEPVSEEWSEPLSGEPPMSGRQLDEPLSAGQLSEQWQLGSLGSQMQPTWIYSALLMTVIIGGMRTTRRGVLQLLQVCAGELWGKMWLFSPYHLLLALKGRRIPVVSRRHVRWLCRAALRMLLGRRAVQTGRCHGGGGGGTKHGLKHGKRRLNRTVNLYRKMPLKAMSRLWGRFNQLELPVFLRRPLLSLYIWMFGCRLDEAEIEDLRHYRNLGEFFRRQLKPHVRPIDDDHVLTSPADGKILNYGKVENGILEQVKGVTYSLRGFLGPQTWKGTQAGDINHMSDDDYQEQLGLHPDNDLFHCIVYLAPGDYHRFHSPTHWRVVHRRHFPGELLSVNPGMARWIQGLFNFNERAVYTGIWEHGFFSMCAVGATNVGSIKIYCDENILDLHTNFKELQLLCQDLRPVVAALQETEIQNQKTFTLSGFNQHNLLQTVKWSENFHLSTERFSCRGQSGWELETNTYHKHQDGTYFDKTFSSAITVTKGSMFGEFNLGSTLVLIFEAPREFEFKVTEGQKIKYGEPIGTSL